MLDEYFVAKSIRIEADSVFLSCSVFFHKKNAIQTLFTSFMFSNSISINKTTCVIILDKGCTLYTGNC